jgi:MFS transporter, MFS domain-containing protein family, molybdate-anion transporter
VRSADRLPVDVSLMYICLSGRKKLCLAFCLTYALTCTCVLVDWLPILLVGRVLGGISTSILYSAFESWLISSATSLALPQSDLSTIMGRATVVNGFVATGAGVFSNQLVSATKSFSSPFIASGALLLLAWVVIRGTWIENYGGGGGGPSSDGDVFQIKRLRQAWRIVRDGTIIDSLSRQSLTRPRTPLLR